MHGKILKAINLTWFQNNASERNNSLNGYSNKLLIQIKSPWWKQIFF